MARPECKDDERERKFRARMLRETKRLINRVPTNDLAAVQNFVVELLPAQEDDYDPMVLEAAAEVAMIWALRDADTSKTLIQ